MPFKYTIQRHCYRHNVVQWLPLCISKTFLSTQQKLCKHEAMIPHTLLPSDTDNCYCDFWPCELDFFNYWISIKLKYFSFMSGLFYMTIQHGMYVIAWTRKYFFIMTRCYSMYVIYFVHSSIDGCQIFSYFWLW